MLRVTRQGQKSGKESVSADELLRELLGGDRYAWYACKGDPRGGRVDIRVLREKEGASQYCVEDAEFSEDFFFVTDVVAALRTPGDPRSPWRATTLTERREFFLAALDLKSRVQVKDLIAAYDLMAETGKSLPVLVGELGLT
jgi:hypothetical protein